MPIIIPPPSTGGNRDQLRNNAVGILSMPLYFPKDLTSGQALTSQILYSALFGFRTGDILSQIQIGINTAAAGTVPTSVLVVVQDVTGKVLFTSEEKNNAIWTVGTGQRLSPLAASYAFPADGAYYFGVWVNGTWGTTQLSVHGLALTLSAASPAGAPWAINPTAASIAVNDVITRTNASALRSFWPVGTAV